MRVERQPRKLTKEHRASISLGTKIALSTPEMRQRLSRIQQRIWNENPQRRLEQARIQTELWSQKEHRQRMSQAHLGNDNSFETRTKISRALKGKLSPLRRREIPQEHKAKIGEAQKRNWKKPQYRENRRKAKEERIAGVKEVEEIETSLWEAAVSENLLEPILKQNLMTSEELDNVKSYFEKGKNPPAKLLDKFSIAVARVA